MGNRILPTMAERASTEESFKASKSQCASKIILHNSAEFFLRGSLQEKTGRLCCT
jgi:hypothetical protein